MPKVGRQRIRVAREAKGEVPLPARFGLDEDGRSVATGRDVALSGIEIPRF